MSGAVNLGFLEGFSYGWHANDKDIKPLRLLKALKTAIQGLFGRFKVEVSEEKIMHMVKKIPDAWFSIKINKTIKQRKVTQAPGEKYVKDLNAKQTPGINEIKEPKANPVQQGPCVNHPETWSRTLKPDYEVAVACVCTIALMESYETIESAISKLASLPIFPTFIEKNTSALDSFFDRFVCFFNSDFEVDLNYAIELTPLVEEILNLGFLPSDREQELKVRDFLENHKIIEAASSDSSFEVKLEWIYDLLKSTPIDGNTGKLTSFNNDVEEDVEEIAVDTAFINEPVKLSPETLETKLPVSEDLKFLTKIQSLKDRGVPLSGKNKDELHLKEVRILNEVADSCLSLSKKQFNDYEKLFTKLFAVCPERSNEFSNTLCSSLENIHGYNMEETCAVVRLLSMLKNAGYNFDSGSFSLEPVNINDPLSLFVMKLFEMFSGEYVDLANGLLGTGIRMSAEQMAAIKQYLRNNKVTITTDIIKALQELEQPEEGLESPELTGANVYPEKLSQLKNALFDKEICFSDKLTHFEDFEKDYQGKIQPYEKNSQYIQMLNLFVRDEFFWFLKAELSDEDRNNGIKLFTKINVHSPGALSKYFCFLNGEMMSILSESPTCNNLSTLFNLIALRNGVPAPCMNLFCKFVSSVMIKAHHGNPDGPVYLGFLSLIRFYNPDLMDKQFETDLLGSGVNKIHPLAKNFHAALNAGEFDFANELFLIGVRLKPASSEDLESMRNQLTTTYPGNDSTINKLLATSKPIN